METFADWDLPQKSLPVVPRSACVFQPDYFPCSGSFGNVFHNVLTRVLC